MAASKLERLQSLVEADPDTARKLLEQLNRKMVVPHAGGQQDVLDAQERFLVLCAGRRWGKTKIGAKCALRKARHQNRMIWWVAPTYKIVKRGYAEVLRQLPPDVLAKPAPSETLFDSGRPVILRFKNGSKMEFYSAERPEGMLGEGVDFVVLDEAATMPRSTWEQIIRPTLADRAGGALLISTPRGRNWYYEIWTRGQDKQYGEYRSWRFPSMTNPTIPETEWQQMRETLPAAVYEQEILAQFISNAASVFRFSEDSAIKTLVAPKGDVIVGVDLAKHRDFTVLDGANADTRLPCYHERFNAVSWPEQRQRIARAVRYIKKQGAQNVTLVVDTTGVGDPIVDDLLLTGFDVVPIKFSQQWKQQAVMLLSSDLEQNKAFIHDEQLNEFRGYAYTITEAGRWTFSAPGGGHDDEVSAKLLQHWEIAQGGTPNVTVLTSDSSIPADGEWDTPTDDAEYWEEAENEQDKIQTTVIHPRTTTDLLNDPLVWS